MENKHNKLRDKFLIEEKNKEIYIEIKGLKKQIENNLVLNNINLNLYKGKVYGFKGKNASGKTMLFRAICGLIKPTEGEIIIGGKTLGKDMCFPESVGVIIEYPGFLPNYTGFQNLKLLADIKGKIDESDINKAIEKVGLDPLDKRKFKKYSLGMKQKLGLAQAIMENPDLIILDEPTNALDDDGVELIKKVILDLKDQGKTILIASHDVEEMESLVDEIYTIKLGEIIDYKVIV